MDPSNVNFLGALVAALSTFLVGGIWYSPILFAKPWMAASGLSDADLKKGGMGKIFGGSFVLALISAVNLAFFLAGGETNVAWGLTAGALTGVGWVVTAMGTTYLFERRPLKLFLIDGGYHAVTFTLMGGILGAWK
jgi:hypothetical protein